MERPEQLELGYVRRAHGVRGELRVKLYNEGSALLEDLTHVWVRRREQLSLERRVVRSVRAAGGGERLISLEGIQTKEQSDALVGASLWVERSQLPPLGPDEYYHLELVGLTVLDEHGAPVGKLEEVLEGVAHDVYVVRGAHVGELLVPATGTHVGTIDLQAGTLRLQCLSDLLGDEPSA